MKKKKVFILGSINMDLVISSERMAKKGETISGNGFFTNPGGKGANQAVAVSKLGGDAVMIGCVGDSFGRELKGTLNGYGVNTEYVRTVPNVSSGVAVITLVNGDNSIILDSGANRMISYNLVDDALMRARAGDYIVCQLEIPQNIVKYAFKMAKQKGMITVLNPTPAIVLDDEILHNCDLFVVNQPEAEFYSGIYPQDDNSLLKCAKVFASKNIKNVIVTLGKNGSYGNFSGRIIKVDSEKVCTVDSTAAGDTYLGAFISRIADGEDPKDAMEFASKSAAITVTRNGAQSAIPYKDEVDKWKA